MCVCVCVCVCVYNGDIYIYINFIIHHNSSTHPISCPMVFLVWGKARSHRVPNLGCSWAESPGWFDVLPKNSAQYVVHEQVHCHHEAANHQLPIAVAFWIIQTVSMGECSNLNLMQIHCSIHSVILNEMATQYTCSLNGVYHLCWLVQWSHHCSLICIPVHSPWLPDYIDTAQTILIILTIAGLFQTHLYTCIKSAFIL